MTWYCELRTPVGWSPQIWHRDPHARLGSVMRLQNVLPIPAHLRNLNPSQLHEIVHAPAGQFKPERKDS